MSSPARGESHDRRLDIFRTLFCIATEGCTFHAVENGLCDKHMTRMRRHGNTDTVKPNGVRCNLTVAQGREIKRLHVGLMTLAKIARRYNVSTDTIRRVLAGKFRFVDAEESADAR